MFRVEMVFDGFRGAQGWDGDTLPFCIQLGMGLLFGLQLLSGKGQLTHRIIKIGQDGHDFYETSHPQAPLSMFNRFPFQVLPVQ